MAAEQLTGRVCACGCGASLEGRHALTVYTRECRERLKVERDVARHRARAKQRRERLGHKSLHPMAAAVWRGTTNDAAHVPTLQCHVCFDLPHARRPDRHRDHRAGYAPSEKMVGVQSSLGWVCSGCGAPYAEEPKPEHGSLIRSSAGTAQKASELWGYQPNVGGADRTKAYRDAKKAGNDV